MAYAQAIMGHASGGIAFGSHVFGVTVDTICLRSIKVFDDWGELLAMVAGEKSTAASER